ncbi:MAG: hypothetical protein HY823_03530 [Acidobacteria bacterium]|nr:hypothetical protein [Acidobacteriota bacterium]
MTNWRRLATALLALPALAQEPQHFLEAQASLLNVSPETRRLVDGRSLAGLSLGVAYRGRLMAGGLQHRVHLDLLGLRAQETTGMEGAAPKHLEFGWDLIFPRGNWSFYSGFLGIRWKQSVDDKTTDEFRDLNLAGTKDNLNAPKGTKFGARLGLEYAFRKDFSVFGSYTQTEFNKLHNPGWWSLGVVYRGMKF